MKRLLTTLAAAALLTGRGRSASPAKGPPEDLGADALCDFLGALERDIIAVAFHSQ